MKIALRALESIVAHARETDPEECCGVLLGAGERIAVAVRGRNADASATRFSLDPRDHIEARRQARASHQEVLGFYHSHPRGSASPSETDVAEWSYPEVVSVIVGVEEQKHEVRAFRIAGGAIEELKLDPDCDE